MLKKFFTWLLIFIGLVLILQSFRTPVDSSKTFVEDLVLKTDQSSYYLGDAVLLTVESSLDQTLRVPSECPAEPFQVERYTNGVWKVLSSGQGQYLQCSSVGKDIDSPLVPYSLVPDFWELTAKTSTTIDYSPWKSQLFDQLGKYRITLSTNISDVYKSFTTEFEVVERGFFSSVTYELFFRPIFNFLLFLTSILPGYNFGLAIIALTLIIRLILLVPNQKALKSQRSMMRIQPELDAIKRKYKGDQTKISQETMALWKQHRVNPIGGCLPLLIQLPFLIAIFYVVRSGLNPYQGEMIYSFLSNIDISLVSSNFFGVLQLEKINATWLPISVGLLQFIQMKLSFSIRKQSLDQNKTSVVEVTPDGKSHSIDELQDPLKMMNKTMIYFMPVMMGFAVATLPSGVGLYLFVSTLFSLAQQFAVNRDIA
jgi:YidC/Oxa1 family membrane protein insertase